MSGDTCPQLGVLKMKMWAALVYQQGRPLGSGRLKSACAVLLAFWQWFPCDAERESGWMLVYEELSMCKGLWACDMHRKAVFQGLCMRAGSSVTRQSARCAHTDVVFSRWMQRERLCP
jgi:hypothetical protein